MFNKIVSSIGAFSYKNRKTISIVALVLFIAVAIIQSLLIIEYSYAEESLVTDIFPQDDTVVIVYENKDEEKIPEVIKYLEKDEHVTSIQAYANTLGMKMSPSDIVEMMGIPESFVNTLFYIYENGMQTEELTLVELINFISSDDFLNNELFASLIDDETKAQIKQMKSLTDAIASNKEYTVDEVAELLNVDSQLVQAIFFISQIKNSESSNLTPILLANLADVLGMDAQTIERIFKIQPAKSLKISEFIKTITDLTAFLSEISNSEQILQLQMLKDMSDAITSQAELSPSELATIFSSAPNSQMFNESTLTLLYIMVESNNSALSDVKISLYDFFIFLSEEILQNDAFSAFFDDNMATQFEEASTMITDGIAQLISEEHSRMVITLDYAVESEAIYDFYQRFDTMLSSTLSGEYYLVGATAMSYDVSKTFKKEFLIISIVTAVAVFLVVWLTFRKFLLSFLLICIIECAVFSMMSIMVAINLPIYFVPLILVQCILMGSMIDYGILFTTYYMEVRKEFSIEQALPEVMRRSTHSILTSSLLIVLVTLICGSMMTGAVASILTTLGIGSLCAILLILFVLPSLLVIFDKHVIKSTKKA